MVQTVFNPSLYSILTHNHGLLLLFQKVLNNYTFFNTENLRELPNCQL